MYVCNFSKGLEKPLAESGLPGDSLMKSYFHHCSLVQTDDSYHGFQSLMDLVKSLKGQNFERSCEVPKTIFFAAHWKGNSGERVHVKKL